jgi:hypothetical protein
MSTLVDIKRVKATRLEFTDDLLVVYLEDARVISVPLIWYPRLFNASPAQRKNFNWIGNGSGIEWPELDEHLSVAGFLAGTH